MPLCSDSTQRACLLVSEGAQWHHAWVCIWCEAPELTVVKSREGVSYTIVDPRDVLWMEVKIALHAKHG